MKLIKTLLFLLISYLVTANEYTVVIIGKTGVGKSSLINSLFGKQLATVGHDEATTMNVEKYTKYEGNNTINIWDTMGLYDDRGEPKEYIHRIADTVKKAHLILICFDSSEARWTKDNNDMLDIIKNELSENIFKNTLFVFTKYNINGNKKSLETRKYKITSIVNNAKFGVAESPETKDWDTTLWQEILTVVKETSKPIFIDFMNRRSRVCLIAKRVKNSIIEHGVFPSNMDKKQIEFRIACDKEKDKYNRNVGFIKNTLATGGALTLYTVAGPVVTAAKLLVGGLSMGLGSIIESKVSRFERNSSYCDKPLQMINMANYNDTYEFSDGKYIGEFKKNLFHGFGTIYDEHNNPLFKGEFNNGLPSTCS